MGAVLTAALLAPAGMADAGVAASDPAVQELGAAALAPDDPTRFGDVGEFALLRSDGVEVGPGDLAGAPWIAIPFFTRCEGPCPRLTADVRGKLHEQLTGTGVRLVSISVDPEHDRPEVLEGYAASFTIDPDRWWFLTGDEEEVHRFLLEGLKLAVRKDATVDEVDPVERVAERFRISHSTRLVAVDGEGRIAGYYSCGGAHSGTELGIDRGTIEASFTALEARVRALAGAPPAAPAELHTTLPRVNATLNGIAFVLLVLGMRAIRRGDRNTHARFMRAAFVVSAAFLGCYLYYHGVIRQEVKFRGTGVWRPLYFAMLVSHILLAAANLPMVLRTLWLARKEDWVRHRRLARWTLPIWMYVSVTGVLVYLVLYHWNPAP